VVSIRVDEACRTKAGFAFAFDIRRGFLPPSCVFVGTVVTVAASPDSVGASSGVEISCEIALSATFRLRLRDVWSETDAAFGGIFSA
jgi:hypothetical protein